MLTPSQFMFPSPLEADPDGEGIIAMGGDLEPSTLLAAYQHGIFPWFAKDEPIYWWSPDPRCIIHPQQFQPSKSLIRQLKKNTYTLTLSNAFEQVVRACAEPRQYANETWINEDIIQGYTGLHMAGYAHSVEVWQDDILVGGLYGVQLGNAFFGESMFSRRTDVSKMAFCFLMNLCAASEFPWVDCQLPNEHLMSLGAVTIARADFLQQLASTCNHTQPNWQTIKQQRFNSQDILSNTLFLDLIKQPIKDYVS